MGQEAYIQGHVRTTIAKFGRKSYAHLMKTFVKSAVITFLAVLAAHNQAGAAELKARSTGNQHFSVELTTRKRADYWFSQARIEWNRQNFDGVIAAYDKLLGSDPQNSRAYHMRASAKMCVRKFAEAKIDFDKCLNLDGSNTWCLMNRAMAKLELKDNKGAMADFDRAIELKPNEAEYYDERGKIKFELGDRQGAIADASKAIVLEPKSAWMFEHRSHLYARMGDRFRALQDYKMACAQCSDFGPEMPAYIEDGYLGDQALLKIEEWLSDGLNSLVRIFSKSLGFHFNCPPSVGVCQLTAFLQDQS